MDDRRKQTIPLSTHIAGNSLFDRAVFAIGLDQGMTRQVLKGAVLAVGSSPSQLTADELGALLPEIDQRLRLLVPPESADTAMKRLRHLLLSWEE